MAEKGNYTVKTKNRVMRRIFKNEEKQPESEFVWKRVTQRDERGRGSGIKEILHADDKVLLVEDKNILNEFGILGR